MANDSELTALRIDLEGALQLRDAWRSGPAPLGRPCRPYEPLDRGHRGAGAEGAALASPAASRALPQVSFEQVYREHCAGVLGTLRRFGVAEPDLQDVCQEVFEKIYVKLPGFEWRSKLSTWVHAFCVHKASDYHRRKRRRREVLDGGAAPEPATPGEQERRSIGRQSAALLQRALATLPEKQMQVFVLYEIEEQPMAEVANLLGCPLFTAYSRLRKARRAIEKFFATQDRRPGQS